MQAGLQPVASHGLTATTDSRHCCFKTEAQKTSLSNSFNGAHLSASSSCHGCKGGGGQSRGLGGRWRRRFGHVEVQLQWQRPRKRYEVAQRNVSSEGFHNSCSAPDVCGIQQLQRQVRVDSVSVWNFCLCLCSSVKLTLETLKLRSTCLLTLDASSARSPKCLSSGVV